MIQQQEPKIKKLIVNIPFMFGTVKQEIFYDEKTLLFFFHNTNQKQVNKIKMYIKQNLLNIEENKIPTSFERYLKGKYFKWYSSKRWVTMDEIHFEVWDINYFTRLTILDEYNHKQVSDITNVKLMKSIINVIDDVEPMFIQYEEREDNKHYFNELNFLKSFINI